MPTTTGLRTVIAALVLAASCGGEPRRKTATPSAATTPIHDRYDAAAIRAALAELAGTLAISPTQRVALREKLDAFLASPKFAAVHAAAGVQAVGVYRLGEGGVVVKIARGDGTMRFAGVQGDREFALRYTSVGAQVGGSASWGVVLATGLRSIDQVEGTYEGAVASATAIEESAGAVRMGHKGDHHNIYLVSIGAGLSANAGEAKLVLALR